MLTGPCIGMTAQSENAGVATVTESADTGGRTTRSVRAAIGRARPIVPSWGRLHLGRAQRVAVGVAIGFAALLVKLLLNALLGGEAGFIPLTVAVVVAAWVCGFPGGMAATLVTAIVNTIVFVAPTGATFELTSIDLARMALYALGGTAVSLLIGSVGSSRDRLETSLAEVASMAEVIERRDERLELVLAASGTGFWEWDITTGELVWSEAIFRQHGLDPADGAPTFERYLETIHRDDVAAFRASIDDALAHGSEFSTAFRLLRPDGSVRWTHGVGRVFRNAAGEPIRMVGTGQDITERQRLEDERDRLLDEERRAGTFREAFIEVISHELRTPITTIFGLTQILGRPGRPHLGRGPGRADRRHRRRSRAPPSSRRGPAGAHAGGARRDRHRVGADRAATRRSAGSSSGRPPGSRASASRPSCHADCRSSPARTPTSSRSSGTC